MLFIPSALKSQATTNRTQSRAICWKITLVGSSTIFRFTDWPYELSLREAEHGAAFTYTPVSGIESSARRREDELKAENKEVRGIVSSDAIKTADLRAGLFDGAKIDEFLVDPRTPWIGYIEHARFYIQKVKYDRGVWEADVAGLPAYLERPVGDIWSPLCRVDLFSTLCGLSSSAFQMTPATVASIQTQRLAITFTYSVMGFPAWDASGYADDGTVVWLTGLNAGLRNIIKTHVDNGSGGAYVLHYPTAYDVAVSDTATLLPGCNKRSGVEKNKLGARIAGHCKDKFNNLVNFQGEPYIPGRDRSLQGIPIK
jgi:uncharacterized phage protein (TIGR02218 family)